MHDIPASHVLTVTLRGRLRSYKFVWRRETASLRLVLMGQGMGMIPVAGRAGLLVGASPAVILLPLFMGRCGALRMGVVMGWERRVRDDIVCDWAIELGVFGISALTRLREGKRCLGAGNGAAE